MRDALAGAIERLRPLGRGVAWVARDNLHVTLKFLGHVEPDRLDRAMAALHAATATVGAFELAVVGLGAFPSPNRPRVVWAGLGAGADAARALAARIDEGLSREGFAKEEREFAGHVTLGRVREPRPDPDLAAAIAAAGGRPFGRLNAERVSLMRSELSPRGARYSVISEWPLARPIDQRTTTTTR